MHLYEELCFDSDLLNSWIFSVEIEAEGFELKKSDPATYDNKPMLIQTLRNNKQWSFCDKLESRGIVLQLLSRFIRESKYNGVSMKDSRVDELADLSSHHLRLRASLRYIPTDQKD